MIGVSVVIPTFNRAELLDVLLASIVAQSFKNIEVIVVDDCSKADQPYDRVIEKYKNLLDLKFLKNERSSGAPYSRNRGIRESKFDLIALVDDDDEWFPQKIEKQVRIFENDNEKLGLVYTWTLVVDKNKNVLDENKCTIEGVAKSKILDFCFISSPSVMVRKAAILDCGMFDEAFPSCQDWDTWTRLIFKEYRCAVVREFVTYYLKHDGPTIGASPKAKLGYLKYYKKHFWKLLRYGKFRHLIRMIRLATGI